MSIKIEPPGMAILTGISPRLPGHPKSDQNYAWMMGSRNKRSLAVDMGKPEGRAAIQRLASKADVFITNYPAAVRKKLGIGYEALAALNDRLIYASFSGYGEKGAEATKPGFDVTAWWARSGLMDTVRASSESVPVRPANGMGDHSAGFTLFSGIMMALYQRQTHRQGHRGQLVPGRERTCGPTATTRRPHCAARPSPIVPRARSPSMR